MFTKKQLIKMYLPLLFENLANGVLSVILTVLFGNLGEHVIGANSISGTILNIAVVVMNGITVGTIVRVSQHIGAKNTEMAEQTARQAIITSVGIISAASLIMIIFSKKIIMLFYGNAAPEIIDAANTLLKLTAVSVVPYALYSTSNGIMCATGDFGRTMRNSLSINILYTVITAVFVLFFDMGVVGIGLALIISRGLFGILVYRGLRKGTRLIRIESAIAKPEPKVALSVLKIGVPSAFEGMAGTGIEILIQTFIVALGSAALAGNAMVGSLSGFAVVAGTALSSLGVTVIGQCFGNGDMKLCRKYMLNLVLIGGAIVMVCAVTVLAFSNGLLRLYNPAPETFRMAKDALFTALITYMFFWSSSVIAPACLRSCGDVKYVVTVSILSLAFVKVPAIWLFTSQMNLGLVGVWLSGGVDIFVKSLFYIPRILSRKWERKEEIKREELLESA